MEKALPPPPPNKNGTVEVCMPMPPRVNSAGIWENPASPSVVLTYSLPLLELQLLLTFLVSQLVYFILRPLGITLFASQMLAGLVTGPGLLGRTEIFRGIFITTDMGTQIVDTVAGFGFFMFLFLMGVKMDMKMAFKSSRRAVLIGIVSLFIPFVAAVIIQEAYKLPNPSNQMKMERIVATITESVTYFAVVSFLLSELKIINTELGRLALTAAVVNDLSSLLLFEVFSIIRHWTMSPTLALGRAGGTAIFIFLLFFVFRPWMFRIIRKTPEGSPIEEVYIVIIMMLALGSSIFTYFGGRTPLLGAFIFGLAVPDGPPLGSALVDKFECFSNGMFLAIYVSTCTMRVHPEMVLDDSTVVQFTCVFITFMFLAKLVSCFLVSRWTMMPARDSLAFGLIMSSKGIVELAYFTSFKENEIVSDETFSVLTIGALLNAIIIPILVKFLYDPVSRKPSYDKRNIMHLKPDSELRILACIHESEHVPALIDLLDITCPTKDSPNVVYALHLIELVGRDTPVFIAHQKNRNRVASSFQYVLDFNQYEENNWGSVTVNAFTAISPYKLMHEDVCTLALDKQTSFILLPFHKKWSIDGSVEVENNAIRNMNCTVMDLAPCSAGILVDRRRKLLTPSTSPYFVGMIFLGGKDDREALTLAKRIARDPRVKLTVIHLTDHESDQDCGDVMDWDTMLDAETLRDVRQNEDSADGCGITYRVEVSNHGIQTSKIVRTLAADYDLIIVGRRHGVDSVQTMGLSDWSEFPELGVIGDLLASPDLDGSISILVVQQQDYVNC
ncbi:hypothetical protein V6N13_069112 [Hibiscus sabdariffa]|uniref:Cation/H+ exchanger domain-containing protein n=1 Tax=Hibiscus sabdariffa TaxID=183260 RepID=A0ABR2QPX4_9ROSI